MVSEKERVLKGAVADFGTLAIHEQREVLLKLQAIHEEALKKRRSELLNELRELGAPSDAETNDRASVPKGVRYRSKKNPLMTWSGRGRMARWLVEEIKETGLPRDAFRVA